MATIRELAGSAPGPLPAHLGTMMNMGVNYFRSVSAMLRSLFRARSKAITAAKKVAAQSTEDANAEG